MTHYSNEYFDLAADRENPHPVRWTGGSRVLVRQEIQPKVALITAVILGILAIFSGVRLVQVSDSGPLTLPLLLLAIGLGWSYSAPPLKLNQRGLGELAGAVLITGITPIFGYYVLAGSFDLLPFLAVFPLCSWQFAVLLVLNIPDAQGDARAGKQTLIWYLGQDRTVRLYLFTLLLLYGSLPVLVLAGLPSAVALSIISLLPVIGWQAWRMAQGAWRDSRKWDSLAFWGFGVLVLLSIAEIIIFMSLWVQPIT
jgi:1,4-dihydroxy-2-naphthoate octaprenyltransferase